MPQPLTIFVLHASDLLTDSRPHGDGLVAYGFIANLALRGHHLHVAAEQVALEQPLPPNVTMHSINVRSKHPVLRRIEYALRVRALYQRLSRSIRFDIVHQLNPVHAGLSLGMLGVRTPVVLGTFIPRWPDDADSLVTLPRTFVSRLRDIAVAPLLIAQQCIAKALLVVSPAALDRIALHRAFTNRIHEVHDGIDTATFVPIPSEDADAARTILFLANLGTRKGMYTLLEAFDIVYAQRPKARLLMAGSGWDEGALVARIAQMRAKSNIVYLGRVERADVPEIMSRATIYCLPSYGEPYGMSVMEAMACGKAIVATNIGGPLYMVPRDGGLHVPVRDAPALAAALIVLLDDSAAVAEMGRVNRTFVEANYAWGKVAVQLENVYRHVI